VSVPGRDRSARLAEPPAGGETPAMPDGVATEELLWPLNEVERKVAPARLYFAGDPQILRTPCVAVVGSRKATGEGRARAARLVRLLVERGVTVVSGLAEGIDTAAHRSAIECGGRTIAVLGTPLDECFPAKNADLLQAIKERHLAISQFAPGTKTGRHSFPIRNRTMALLSDATVIIEAQEGSGSLHQAWEALRLGRQLFLAKSLFDDPSLGFPRELERYGAEALVDEESVDLLCNELPRGRSGQAAELPF
jgi:DNA processing protein